MTAQARVTSVRAYSRPREQTWEVVVCRLGPVAQRVHGDDPPVADVPDDVRRALLDWLAGGES